MTFKILNLKKSIDGQKNSLNFNRPTNSSRLYIARRLWFRIIWDICNLLIRFKCYFIF